MELQAMIKETPWVTESPKVVLFMELQAMIKEATDKGLKQLEELRPVLEQLAGKDKDGIEEYFLKNDKPAVRPWCIKCKVPFVYIYPLVDMDNKGNLFIRDKPEYFASYFNSASHLRLCIHCGETFPKTEVV